MGRGLKRAARAVSSSTRGDPETHGDRHTSIEEKGGVQSDQQKAAGESEALGDGVIYPEHPQESYNRANVLSIGGVRMRKRKFFHGNGGHPDIKSTGIISSRAIAAETIRLESRPTRYILRRKAPSGADVSEANSSSEPVQSRIRESRNIFNRLSPKRGDERKSMNHMKMEAGLLGAEAKKPPQISAIDQLGEVIASYQPLPLDTLDVGESTSLNDNIVRQKGRSCQTRTDQLQLGLELKSKVFTKTKSSRVVQFEFSRQAQRQQPSVSQLKNALFLESSKVNCSADAERAFAKYLGSLEQYITSDSLSSGQNRSRFAVEDILSTFLTTEKLKYLHNKLLLAIMSEAMGTKCPARHISQHLPKTWESKIMRGYTTEAALMDLYLQQWKKLLDKDSGAWTTYGQLISDNPANISSNNVLLNCNTDKDSGAWTTYGQLISDNPANISSNNVLLNCNTEIDITPPARIPAALQISPFMRQHASKYGMSVSENAIWMLVVAAQEYMKRIIQKTISAAGEVNAGYASELPKSNIISLVYSEHDVPKKKSGGNVDQCCETSGKEKQIGAPELAVMLASNPLIGGGRALSRMTQMQSSISNEKGTTKLAKVNSLINASIQQSIHPNASKAVEKANSLPNNIIEPRTKTDNDAPASHSSTITNHAKDTLLKCVSSPSAPLSFTTTTQTDPNDQPPYHPIIAKAHFHSVNSAGEIDLLTKAETTKQEEALVAENGMDELNPTLTPDIEVTLPSAPIISNENGENEWKPTTTTLPKLHSE